MAVERGDRAGGGMGWVLGEERRERSREEAERKRCLAKAEGCCLTVSEVDDDVEGRPEYRNVPRRIEVEKKRTERKE